MRTDPDPTRVSEVRLQRNSSRILRPGLRRTSTSGPEGRYQGSNPCRYRDGHEDDIDGSRSAKVESGRGETVESRTEGPVPNTNRLQTYLKSERGPLFPSIRLPTPWSTPTPKVVASSPLLRDLRLRPPAQSQSCD